ncbi:MAG TPA: GNAT family N-acetyltransferase [Thermoanaerobaculia bacterium]|nr:GNAT family N-acetyltransferase [Thermoanaerobaculia bacterium]
MPVETRACAPGDEAQILDLFARAFPHAPRSLAHFEWKYRRNPFGNDRISLSFDDGKLVAHYAGYAVPFFAYGRDVLAHQIGDTMTDVSVRHIGRGPTSIIGRTALDFYARFCEGRIAFNYGFNAGNIQKISLRYLRSDRVEPVTYRVAPRPHGIGRYARWLRGFQLEIVRETTPEWDALFARCADAYRFLVRRDAAYVRWRYLECPDTKYHVIAIRKWRRLVGWIVFRIRDDRFAWGDALFDPNDLEAMEVALRHVVPAYPVAAIEAWFPPRPVFFDEALRRLGFVTRPEPQDLSVMCVPFTWTDVVEKMRADLFYAWGDSDLF